MCPNFVGRKLGSSYLLILMLKSIIVKNIKFCDPKLEHRYPGGLVFSFTEFRTKEFRTNEFSTMKKEASIL